MKLTPNDFFPFGEDGQTYVVRGWHDDLTMLGGVYCRLIEDLMPPAGGTWENRKLALDDLLETMDDLGPVTRGWARFWEPGDKGDPYGGDGGVKLSTTFKWGYRPATWVLTY